MKKLINLLLVIIAINTTSCDVVETEKIRSFVVSYIEIDSVRLDTDTGYGIRIGRKDYDNSNDWVNWKSTGDDKVKYDALCSKHNDMGYFKKVSYIAGPFSGHYFMDDIYTIDIVSDKTFDSSHPAGVSLKDIVRFCSASPAPFIQSRYKSSYDWSIVPEGFKKAGEFIILPPSENNLHNGFDYVENYPIDDLLVNLIPEKLELVGLGNGLTIGILMFESNPDLVPATHRFTVKLTTNTGKTLTADIDYKFK